MTTGALVNGAPVIISGAKVGAAVDGAALVGPIVGDSGGTVGRNEGVPVGTAVAGGNVGATLMGAPLISGKNLSMNVQCGLAVVVVLVGALVGATMMGMVAGTPVSAPEAGANVSTPKTETGMVVGTTGARQSVQCSERAMSRRYPSPATTDVKAQAAYKYACSVTLGLLNGTTGMRKAHDPGAQIGIR